MDITHIKSEEVISVQKQHQFMDLFTNHICIIHTREVTSVGHKNQFLKDYFFVCLRKLVMLLRKLINLSVDFSPWSNKSFSNLWSINSDIWYKRIMFSFSKNSHVESLDRFRKSVVDRVITQLGIKKKNIIQKKIIWK